MNDKPQQSTHRLKLWAAPILSVLLLGGLLLERQSWPDTQDVGGYHAAVRGAVESVPLDIGPWRGSDVPLPEGAIDLLKPNVILSRRYEHEGSGRAFQFLIVHCRDARDMLGHYPPRCYPSQGWEMNGVERTQWQQPGGTTVGKRYHFEKALRGRVWRQSVINLIVLPNGTYGMDMNDVHNVAADRKFRVYGAAQVQLVFSDEFSPDEQHQITKRFIDASTRAIDAVQLEQRAERGEQ